jgi:hypothetical protein
MTGPFRWSIFRSTLLPRFIQQAYTERLRMPLNA